MHCTESERIFVELISECCILHDMKFMSKEMNDKTKTTKKTLNNKSRIHGASEANAKLPTSDVICEHKLSFKKSRFMKIQQNDQLQRNKLRLIAPSWTFLMLCRSLRSHCACWNYERYKTQLMALLRAPIINIMLNMKPQSARISVKRIHMLIENWRRAEIAIDHCFLFAHSIEREILRALLSTRPTFAGFLVAFLSCSIVLLAFFVSLLRVYAFETNENLNEHLPWAAVMKKHNHIHTHISIVLTFIYLEENKQIDCFEWFIFWSFNQCHYLISQYNIFQCLAAIWWSVVSRIPSNVSKTRNSTAIPIDRRISCGRTPNVQSITCAWTAKCLSSNVLLDFCSMSCDRFAILSKTSIIAMSQPVCYKFMLLLLLSQLWLHAFIYQLHRTPFNLISGFNFMQRQKYQNHY